jgi:hypothetical protein
MPEEELFRKVLPIAEQVKGNQRNLPCPCGSGRKYKKCHGSIEKVRKMPGQDRTASNAVSATPHVRYRHTN